MLLCSVGWFCARRVLASFPRHWDSRRGRTSSRARNCISSLGSYFSHGPEFLISKKGRRKEEGERRKRKRKENEEKEREGYRTKRHTCLIIKYNIVGTYCCSSVYELFVIGWWCCEAKNKQVGQSLLYMVTRKLNNDDVFLCIDVFCIIAVWSVSQSISPSNWGDT